MSESWGFETKQVHAGASPDPTTGARAVPIYQTTSYVFRDTAHAAALFGLEELGNIYTRIMNPTQAVFEERMAALEGGVGALATASGQAARVRRAPEPGRERRPHRVVGLALRRHLQPAALHVPEARAWRSASSTTPTTSTRGAPPSARTPRRSTARASATRRATCSTSRASPTSRTSNGIPLVDRQHAARRRTCCRPLEHGADIVVHSATKFIGGHGTSIGGVIVDGGKFDYAGSGRFPNFTEPDPSYHGLVFSQLPEPLRPAQYILKARLQYQRDIGPAISPFNSFLFLQGLETLRLRMERHCAERARGRAVARGARRGRVGDLPGPGVEPVVRAGEEVPAQRARARSSRFGIKGGLEAGQKFIDCAGAVQPPRQRRRRAQPRHPPGDHHAPAARRRGAGHHRGHARPRAAVGRASSASTTSSPTSTPGSAPPRSLSRRAWPTPLLPVTGAWRPGDDPGRRQFAHVRRRRSKLEAGGALETVTVAYETWGTLAPDASNAVLVLHALTGDSHAAGPAGPGHGDVGWWDGIIGPGRADRHRPLLRGVPERARRLPGHDRAGVRRDPTAGPTGRASR